ncbi:MAG: NAD-dependent succinate-semialdehyde dehydrogenase [Gammaproteobacteria bacterium]|nr:NAD-dependent succinate-semialdehyde dehydrogenase [Gammaproteobacteria bacterium]
MSTIEIRNPANGNLVKTYEEMSEAELNTIIDSTFNAFQEWKSTSFKTRSSLMRKAGEILRNNSREYAELMMIEMGKPIKSGISEVEKCAWCCDYFAENAESFLAPEMVATGASKSYVTYPPLGVVLAIMPWNFPFWQVFRFAAPGLMAGNVGILKHASNTTGCSVAIEEVFSKAGFPRNVFRSVIVSNQVIDEAIPNKKIAAVTLTGSTRAGMTVGEIAGSCLKKGVYELGGSDPYLILADADLVAAVEICVASRLTNAGQSCIAAKRFIVVEEVKEEFENLFVKKMSEVKMGDPAKEDTEMGPQARYDLRDALHRQVKESIEKGAVCLLGGSIPNLAGAYYPPTVLTNVKKGMPAYEEELFGPVAAIIPVKDEEEAVFVANDSEFGLGAAVFTQNREKGEDIAANRLEAGSCFVNGLVKSDPRMPFGGIKHSGYGRELSRYGIQEFVNIKSVIVE